MAPHNLSQIADNSTTLLEMTQSTNTVLVGGWLGTLILIGTSFMFFNIFMFFTGDAKKSLLGTSFLAFSSSILLRSVSLIPDLVLFTTLILTAVTIAFTFKNN